MKGAIDGGIHIPHKSKIFPSEAEESEEEDKKAKKNDKKGQKNKVNEEKKEKEFDGTMLRDRIFGKHVQEWMNAYDKKKDKQDYQFSKWKECLSKAKVKTIEELYKKVHAEIRKNPLKEKEKQEKPKYKRNEKDKNLVIPPKGKRKTRKTKI